MTDRSRNNLLPSPAQADENQIASLHAHLENLQGHLDRCQDIDEARLAKLVLSACQAIYDFEPASDALIARKRRVFESINSGNMIMAICAVLPERISTRYGAKRDVAFARLENERGTSVRTMSSSIERALLAAVIKMAIALHADSQSLEGLHALRVAA